MSKAEFFSRLKAIYPKSPTSQALSEYQQKLWDWHVSTAALDRLYAHVTQSYEYFPTMAQFITAAQETGIASTRRAQVARTWVLFSHGGVRYATPGQQAPAGANDQRLAIPNAMQYHADYTQLTGDDARVFFMQGWIAEGADPAAASEIYARIDREARHIEPAIEISDDDIPF